MKIFNIILKLFSFTVSIGISMAILDCLGFHTVEEVMTVFMEVCFMVIVVVAVLYIGWFWKG